MILTSKPIFDLSERLALTKQYPTWLMRPSNDITVSFPHLPHPTAPLYMKTVKIDKYTKKEIVEEGPLDLDNIICVFYFIIMSKQRKYSDMIRELRKCLHYRNKPGSITINYEALMDACKQLNWDIPPKNSRKAHYCAIDILLTQLAKIDVRII